MRTKRMVKDQETAVSKERTMKNYTNLGVN